MTITTMAEHGLIGELCRGQRVEMACGPLAGAVGFVAQILESGRVRVKLAALQGVSIIIDATSLRAVNSDAAPGR